MILLRTHDSTFVYSPKLENKYSKHLLLVYNHLSKVRIQESRPFGLSFLYPPGQVYKGSNKLYHFSTRIEVNTHTTI